MNNSSRLEFDEIRQQLGKKGKAQIALVDYSPLIKLSNYATVDNMTDNLMSKAAGSCMIEGILTRFVYFPLYKMHQLAIMGYIRAGIITAANFLTQQNTY